MYFLRGKSRQPSEKKGLREKKLSKEKVVYKQQKVLRQEKDVVKIIPSDYFIDGVQCSLVAFVYL